MCLIIAPKSGTIERMTLTQPFPLYGHEWAAAYLQRGMHNGRVRHAYLITGPESVGKHTLALSFAAALQCQHADLMQRPCGECRSCKLLQSGNHPDLIYSQLDASGALKIEEIRAVMSRLALKPFEARYRIAILSDFDHARPQAQDALLKTLEEPPGAAILILLASAADALLPTILSRCQSIALTLLPAEVVAGVLRDHFGAEVQQADLLARLSGGRLGWAIRAHQQPETLEQRKEALDLLENALTMNRAKRFNQAESLAKDGDRQALVTLLELWQTYWRDVLLMAENSGLPIMHADRDVARTARGLPPERALAALKATQIAMQQIRQNVNVRLALEVMFLDYPGLK